MPSDRRVWQESRALVEAGFDVTVICPTGAKRDREREAVIDGVRILRYPLRTGVRRSRRLPAGVLARALAYAPAGIRRPADATNRHRPGL